MRRLSRSLEKVIFIRDKGLCQICGRNVEFDFGQLDHIKPASKGGGDDPENLQWSCHRCNLLKGNKLTNGEVRNLLLLPEKLEDILKIEAKEKTIKELPAMELMKTLPALSQDGLDKDVVKEGIRVFQESYLNETIIPDVCANIVLTTDLSPDFTNIMVHYRLPREWFMPYEVTGKVFCNEPLFAEFGHSLAISEHYYIENLVLRDEKIPTIKCAFSPDGILEAIGLMRERGFEPEIIAVPLKYWTEMQFWSKDAHVEWQKGSSVSNLSASLVLKNLKLGIINPIGKFPKETILLNKKAITWIVKRYPDNCAAYITLGNDQLYPLKYSELLAGTMVNYKLISEGISILAFGN